MMWYAFLLCLVGFFCGTVATLMIVHFAPGSILIVTNILLLLFEILWKLAIYFPIFGLGILFALTLWFANRRHGQRQPLIQQESSAERGHAQEDSPATATSSCSVATEALRAVTTTLPAARFEPTGESTRCPTGILIRPGSQRSTSESDQSTSQLIRSITPTIFVTPAATTDVEQTRGATTLDEAMEEQSEPEFSEPGTSWGRRLRGKRVMICEPPEAAVLRETRSRRGRGKVLRNTPGRKHRSYKKAEVEKLNRAVERKVIPSYSRFLRKYRGAGGEEDTDDDAGAMKYPNWHDFEQKGVPLGSRPRRAALPSTSKEQQSQSDEEFDKKQKRFRTGLHGVGGGLWHGPKFDDESDSDDGTGGGGGGGGGGGSDRRV